MTAFAVRRWQATLVAFLLLSMLGISAFLSIPRSVDPHFPIPNVIVTVLLPGADAAEMEESVAKPIEEVLQGLDHIRTIGSTSTDGTAVIAIEFEHGTDADQSLDRVVREVGAIRDSLPQGIQRIAYRRPRTTEAGVLQLALVSDSASWRRMAKYAIDLRRRLNVVPGVRAVAIDGSAEPEVRVGLDAGRLAAARLPSSAVVDAIAAGGADLPAGSVNAGNQRYDIAAGGSYRDLDTIRAVPLRGGDGRLLRVRDIAQVDWAEAEQLHIARFNGHRALFVTIRQKDEVDVKSLRDNLIQTVDQFRTQLPPDIVAKVGFDQSKDITKKLNQLGRDFTIALLLVMITIFPIGIRSSLIIMISIPLSLSIGIFTLSLLGYSLNQISIAGFIISLGLLVDDSIVVTENIARRIRNGETPITAAISGTREIAAAVTGATMVLLFAFLPLTALPDIAGDFVRGLPVAVIATVGSSLIVSLTIIPFIASRVLKVDVADGNFALRTLMDGIQRLYFPLLHRALDRPRLWFWSAMILCLGVFGVVPVLGFSLFPSAETPYFLVRVATPEGSGIPATDSAVRDVSAILAREDFVVDRMENAGRGNPQIFYNVLPQEERPKYGEILVTTKGWDVSSGPKLLARLRSRLAQYPNARVTILTFENGPALAAPVEIRVVGPNLRVLKTLSDEVTDRLHQLPGLRDIDNPLAFSRVRLNLGVDEAEAAVLGVPPGAIRRTVRLSISGETASQFRDSEGDAWPVTVRLPMMVNQPVSALGKIYLPTTQGASIPLLDVAHPRLESVPPEINRYNLQRTVTITAYNQPGVLTSDLTKSVLTKLHEIKLPLGYSFGLGGEAEATTRNFSGLGPIVLLAVFGIVGVLVVEFGSFRETAVVAGVVPLGTFGGLMALLFTGNSLSFLAIIGFVALIGIEIKNSILLVDFATQLRRRGVDLREAIETAGEIRFLPVLLTSITAIGGLLPLALGGSALYSPLAWVIIGGLVSSTLLSRIITPVMYLLAMRGDITPVKTVVR